MLIFSLDTKKCMNALLLHPAFDSFLFIEGDITTFNTFQFNGRLKKDFFSTEEKEALDDREYALWKELREFCLSLIKGKRTPLGFHFVLSMSAPNIARLLEQEHLSFAPADVQGLYLNFKYDGTKLSCSRWTNHWSRHGTRWRNGFLRSTRFRLRLSKILKIVVRQRA